MSAPSVDDLEKVDTCLLHARREDGEIGDAGQFDGLLQELLVREATREGHDIRRGGVHEVADHVVGAVQHRFDRTELVEEHQVDGQVGIVNGPDVSNRQVHVIGHAADHGKVERVRHLDVPRVAGFGALAVHDRAVPRELVQPLR